MRPKETIDPTALALQALATTLSEERRAERLLALTGLTPDELRARADRPDMLSACLSFLEAHEPDLLSVARAMGVAPETLVAARRSLES